MAANAFVVLNVTSSSSDEEVRRAFRAAALVAHPDKGGTAAQFNLASWAADTIGSVAGRQVHAAVTRPVPAGAHVRLVGLTTSMEQLELLELGTAGA